MFQDISTLPNIKNPFVQNCMLPILERVIDPSTDLWFGKDLLKTFNDIIKNSDETFRINFVNENTIYM